MYRCGICSRSVEPGKKANRVVVSRRTGTYPHRSEAHRTVKTLPNGKTIRKLVDDPGGTGWEIVREVYACWTCWKRQNSRS